MGVKIIEGVKIIIPTCGGECLETTLRGLAKSKLSVIDNFHTDIVLVYNENDSRRGVRIGRLLGADWPAFRLAAFPYRIGYTRALDWGWKLAEPKPNDVVVVLNDDVVIAGDWFGRLFATLQSNPNAQVGPSLRYLDRRGYGWLRQDTGCGGIFPETPLPYLEGWCWAARAETIENAGGVVDLTFVGTYCEDCDLSLRIVESGGKVLSVPDLPIEHIGHQSTDQAALEQWKINRQRLVLKWGLS